MAAQDDEPALGTHLGAASFEAIYAEHSVLVWRNALRLGVPRSSVDDVLQEVFIVVQRRLGDFNNRSTMRSWIFGILVNVVRHHRRTYRRKHARCVPLDDNEAHENAGELGSVNPNEQVEHAERVRLLEELLSQLDEQKRTLLVLSELEGWTLREIAAHVGSNINTVHSRLRRAKKAFDELHRCWLAKQGDAP